MNLKLHSVALVTALAAFGVGCSTSTAPATASAAPEPLILSTVAGPFEPDERTLEDPFFELEGQNEDAHMLGLAAPQATAEIVNRSMAHVELLGVGRVSGNERAAIRQVARAHLRDIERCYDIGTARTPELEGHVTVQFVIGPNGRVPASVVGDSSIDDPYTSRCIAQAVKRWHFPKPQQAGGPVTYSFSLSPK